jgi:hypothetical protein
LQWIRYTVSNLVASTTSSRIRFESTTAQKWGPGIDDVSVIDMDSTNATLTISLGNSVVTLGISGVIDYTYQIEYTTNLLPVAWFPLTNVTLTPNPYQIINFGPPSGTSLFFRAIQSAP